ncbi:MAG: hypothetical protein IKN04_16655 [Clostridia bacterium]|nr:hypothetical protein [Clostridia bacterium]
MVICVTSAEAERDSALSSIKQRKKEVLRIQFFIQRTPSLHLVIKRLFYTPQRDNSVIVFRNSFLDCLHGRLQFLCVLFHIGEALFHTVKTDFYMIKFFPPACPPSMNAGALPWRPDALPAR